MPVDSLVSWNGYEKGRHCSYSLEWYCTWSNNSITVAPLLWYKLYTFWEPKYELLKTVMCNLGYWNWPCLQMQDLLLNEQQQSKGYSMSVLCTRLLLVNYGNVIWVFHSMAPLETINVPLNTAHNIHSQVKVRSFQWASQCVSLTSNLSGVVIWCEPSQRCKILTSTETHRAKSRSQWW